MENTEAKNESTTTGGLASSGFAKWTVATFGGTEGSAAYCLAMTIFIIVISNFGYYIGAFFQRLNEHNHAIQMFEEFQRSGTFLLIKASVLFLAYVVINTKSADSSDQRTCMGCFWALAIFGAAKMFWPDLFLPMS